MRLSTTFNGLNANSASRKQARRALQANKAYELKDKARKTGRSATALSRDVATGVMMVCC